MIFRRIAVCFLAFTMAAGMAVAGECPGNPDALGTSRILSVDPSEHPLVGSIQYRETLPLADHEVVLTFDDGPIPPHTTRILDILRGECIKATFFIVGSMARNAPAVLRRAYDEGHTIGGHSQNHPLNLSHLPPDVAWNEMADGMASVRQALGPKREVAPFIRFPALNRTSKLEVTALASGLMVWSADLYVDDWLKITPEEVVRRPLERLDQTGKGVVLLHDIQPRTVAALPAFLNGLKQRGFKIVHVVPARDGQAKTQTASAQWHALERSLLGLPAKMLAPQGQ